MLINFLVCKLQRKEPNFIYLMKIGTLARRPNLAKNKKLQVHVSFHSIYLGYINLGTEWKGSQKMVIIGWLEVNVMCMVLEGHDHIMYIMTVSFQLLLSALQN